MPSAHAGSTFDGCSSLPAFYRVITGAGLATYGPRAAAAAVDVTIKARVCWTHSSYNLGLSFRRDKRSEGAGCWNFGRPNSATKLGTHRVSCNDTSFEDALARQLIKLWRSIGVRWVAERRPWERRPRVWRRKVYSAQVCHPSPFRALLALSCLSFLTWREN